VLTRISLFPQPNPCNIANTSNCGKRANVAGDGSQDRVPLFYWQKIHDKNPCENFPGPFRSQRMFKYKEKNGIYFQHSIPGCIVWVLRSQCIAAGQTRRGALQVVSSTHNNYTEPRCLTIKWSYWTTFCTKKFFLCNCLIVTFKLSLSPSRARDPPPLPPGGPWGLQRGPRAIQKLSPCSQWHSSCRVQDWTKYKGPRKKRPRASFTLMVTLFAILDIYCEFMLNLLIYLLRGYVASLLLQIEC